MNEILTAYRDDGPLCDLVARAARVPLQALPLTAAGFAAVAVGLAVDRTTTGRASLLGIAAFVLLATLAAAARRHPRIQWLVPPLLRAGEYIIVMVLAWRSGRTETWLAYVLLAMIAFHHYDIVYRLRHQRAVPSRVVSYLCGGWEVRTLVVAAATVLGVLAPVLAVAAAWCGALFVSESMRSWVVLAMDETRRAHVGAEIEEEEV